MSGNEVWRADFSQKLVKFSNSESQTRALHYQCTYKVWCKSKDIYSSYHPKTKDTDIWWADNCQKLMKFAH